MTATAVAVREHGILFSGPMVRALLRETNPKTQTRRVITDANSQGNYPASCLLLDDPRTFVDPGPSPAGNVGPYLHAPINAPAVEHRYGWQPGDCDPTVVERLYPRYAVGDRLWVRETLRETPRDGWVYDADKSQVALEADSPYVGAMISWAHHNPRDVCVSIHMPRWASRLTLEITGVRVERVQAISEEDAIAEGCFDEREHDGSRPSDIYRQLWQSLNAKRGYAWDRNPWVWVLSFRQVTP